MADWNVQQVSDWLEENGFRKQVAVFQERSIDGQKLMKLTEHDISELFSEIREDRSRQPASIGVKSRFRSKLIEWKRNKQTSVPIEPIVEKNADVPPIEPIVEKKADVPPIVSVEIPLKKEEENVLQEATYLIDKDLDVAFCEKRGFLQHFINFIKQETNSIDIQIERIHSDEQYSMKLIGTKQQIRTVRKFTKKLLESIRTRKYQRKDLPNWSARSKPIELIQKIFDEATSLFVICELDWPTVIIHYFDNEKFNAPYKLTDIDDILRNQILQRNFYRRMINDEQVVRFLKINSQQIEEELKFAATKHFDKEYEEILKNSKRNFSLINIKRDSPCKIEIFGDEKSVNEIFDKFKQLFRKHIIKRFQFNQFSPIEIDFLDKYAWNRLRAIEREQDVKFNIKKNEFFTSECKKNGIESQVQDILSQRSIKTLKSFEFYDYNPEKFCSKLRNLAETHQTYCDMKLNSKSRAYTIPKGHGKTSHTSKSIVEQSEIFCSTFSVKSQAKLANNSIDVLIDDIAQQKVDVLIIPSMSSGLKEHLITRAGQVTVINKSDSLITEISPGNLKCQKILFVDWSVPTMVIDDEQFGESIELFIFRVFQHLNRSQSTVRSIAFAVPDMCKQEEILADELVEATIHQMKSSSFKVSFVLTSDQRNLYNHFLKSIENLQQGEENFGVFYCSMTSITVTMMSMNGENLEKCERKINNYLQRSKFDMKLDTRFQLWSQLMINAFYKYALDRCVIPKIDQDGHAILHGQRSNADEVHQRYELIQQKNQYSSRILNRVSLSDYNLMIIYAPETAEISQRLVKCLSDDGFSISNNDLNKIKRKIKKSDCILVCLSEYFIQTEFYRDQINYAEKFGKVLIPIKSQYIRTNNWLEKLIQRHSFFNLFGSENNFQFQYDKILLKILNCCSSETDKHIQWFFLLTPEQKKARYEANIKKLKKPKSEERQWYLNVFKETLQRQEKEFQKDLAEKTDRLPDEDSPEYAEAIQSIRDKLGITSTEKLLNQYEQTQTLLNFTPFTMTGDINDAIFLKSNSIIMDFYGTLYLTEDEKSLSSSHSKEIKRVISFPRKKKVKKVLRQSSIQSSNTNEIEARRNSSTSETATTSRKSSTQSSNPTNHRRYQSRYQTQKKEPKIEKPQISISDIEEMKQKFIAQLERNQKEFDEFCEKYEPIKQTIHSYPTVFFGPNPFGEVKAVTRPPQLSKKKISLPLKFPWNGVIVDEKRVVTVKHSEVLFSFEQNQ